MELYHVGPSLMVLHTATISLGGSIFLKFCDIEKPVDLHCGSVVMSRSFVTRVGVKISRLINDFKGLKINMILVLSLYFH